MWNCCRTCLKETCLSDIFSIPNKHSEYSTVLLKTTGLEIKFKDSLPQQICEKCIRKINDYMEFRANCYRSYKILIESVVNRFENNTSKNEDAKVYSRSPSCSDDYYNNTDNTMNDDQSNEGETKVTKKESHYIEYEMSVQDIVENSYKIRFDNMIGFEKADLVYDKAEPKVEPAKIKRLSKADVACKFCHEKFNSKVAMYNHYKTHTGKTVICEHCGAKFSTKRRLLIHCRAKHGYEKVDKCSFCDYKATNAESVKIHERTHTGEKPFVCSQCGAAFHRRSCYLQHLPIHLSQKTVQCDECPSMFKSVTLMKIHKTRHRKRNGRNS